MHWFVLQVKKYLKNNKFYIFYKDDCSIVNDTYIV